MKTDVSERIRGNVYIGRKFSAVKKNVVLTSYASKMVQHKINPNKNNFGIEEPPST